MSKLPSYFLMILGLLCAPQSLAQSRSGGPWLEVEIGIIGTASTEILTAALAQAKAQGQEGVLVTLDTPGGLLEATRSMVKTLLDTDMPVIVWVAPPGAHAASAGTFITLAAPIAAMAPGTNIGAAHPVFVGQGGDEESKRKALNDTTALMASIASLRGRDAEIAASFVIGSLSLTAQEALEKKVIDVVAANPTELFHQIAGRTVHLRTRDYTFTGEAPQIITFEKSLRQRVLEILSNPDLFYVLLLAGLVGLGVEITHPGVLFPGVLGAISLILALLATSVLPVNFAALLLVLVSLAFIVAEAFLPSFGVLGIGGVIAFILGSSLLVDPNNAMGLKLSWYTILPGALTFALFATAISWLVMRAARRRVATGAEGMIGDKGVVITAFSSGKGRVRVMGENWQARSADGTDLILSAEVEVRGVDGLELIVVGRPGQPPS